jgi:hypothetical protein
MALSKFVLFLNSPLLVLGEVFVLLKSMVLALNEMALLLEKTSLLFDIDSKSANVHAKRSSGVSDALLNSVLNHRAHVIVDVDETMVSGTLNHGIGSIIVAVLMLNSLKVVVDTTGGFLLVLAVLRGSTLLDTQGNLLSEVDVRRGSILQLVTTNTSKMNKRAEVVGDSISIESSLCGGRKLSVVTGLSDRQIHELDLGVGENLAITDSNLCLRVQRAVALMRSLGAEEESLDG